MATRHNAFISGAGRNIGRATALELARRGTNVIINGARNRAMRQHQAHDAVGGEHHHRDEQHADIDQPGIGQQADAALQQRDQHLSLIHI